MVQRSAPRAELEATPAKMARLIAMHVLLAFHSEIPARPSATGVLEERLLLHAVFTKLAKKNHSSGLSEKAFNRLVVASAKKLKFSPEASVL